jgi:Leucine-rich repeat (LRR) protein
MITYCHSAISCIKTVHSIDIYITQNNINRLSEAGKNKLQNYFLRFKQNYILNSKKTGITLADYIALNGMPQIVQQNGFNVLDLSNKGLTSLEGLDTITSIATVSILILNSNQLTSLSDGVFQGLSQLQKLWLNTNQLTSLSDGVFQGLSQLRDLGLNGNQLTSLPDGVFQGLSQLRGLSLNSNQLTNLQAGVFQGLSNLQELWLYNNKLTSLQSGVFNNLSQLRDLGLNNNKLISLPEGVFQGLSQLRDLGLNNNKLISLSDVVFKDLSNLQRLGLNNNQLTSLSDVVFKDLSNLQALMLNNNQLTSLPKNIFAGLNALSVLGIGKLINIDSQTFINDYISNTQSQNFATLLNLKNSMISIALRNWQSQTTANIATLLDNLNEYRNALRLFSIGIPQNLSPQQQLDFLKNEYINSEKWLVGLVYN